MPYVFNLGLVTSLHTIVYPCFFMNIDLIYQDLIDLVHIPPFVNHIFNVFINIYEYAN